MRYRVQRVEVRANDVDAQLERALERLTGELVAVVPIVTPVFMPFGGAARTSRLLLVERSTI